MIDESLCPKIVVENLKKVFLHICGETYLIDFNSLKKEVAKANISFLKLKYR